MNRHAKAAAELIEDVEWLASVGESTETIVRRLNRHPEAIARRLHRHGRTDLARPFWALANRERKTHDRPVLEVAG